MKKNLLFLVLVVFIFSGCVPIMLYHAGIRIPKEETPVSIKEYAVKMKQDTNNLYIFRDSSAFFQVLRSPAMHERMFSAIVFSKNGLVVNYKDSSSCQWSAGHYIAEMKKDSGYIIDESCRYEPILEQLISVSGEDPPVFDTVNFDFLVIFTWAKFITKMNERLFIIPDAAMKNKNARIQVVSVNTDMQESWQLKKDQRIVLNQ